MSTHLAQEEPPSAEPPAAPAAAPAPPQFVAWLRAVAPYIHGFRGKTFVVAFPGELVLAGRLNTLIQDIGLLHAMGMRIVSTAVGSARPDHWWSVADDADGLTAALIEQLDAPVAAPSRILHPLDQSVDAYARLMLGV